MEAPGKCESPISLAAIARFRQGDLQILRQEKWLRYLALTPERSVNMERLQSLTEVRRNYVLDYVEETLRILSELSLDPLHAHLVNETLKWAEVAKTGLPHQRRAWIRKGYNLFVHNEGSAQIYREEAGEKDPVIRKVVGTLISMHGLIGQHIRGEVPLARLQPLHALVSDGTLTPETLRSLIGAMDACVIGAVGRELWENIREEAGTIADRVADGQFQSTLTVKDRICKLRARSIALGENFDAEYERCFGDPVLTAELGLLLENVDLWYVEAALADFSFEEFLKILRIAALAVTGGGIRHISFERLMRDIYYEYEGKKKVNVYKKRILEKYLADLHMETITEGAYPKNPHVMHDLTVHDELGDTLFFSFRFSPAGSSLIDFCMEAEKSEVLYEQAIILLFDLFGLRRDAYDRFNNEESYLRTMNSTIDFKKIILDYITGNRILDIGPGGGALMDLIVGRFPAATVTGVDIAQNVLDALQKKKQLENRTWNVMYGDALNLGQTIGNGEVDTVIFCSILHELFSYIEYEGRKFNHDTLATALKGAFDLLPVGGRIIIRDGIMTEPTDQKRIIRFLAEDGMEFLKRYASDFKGRSIMYESVGKNEVLMPVNDAMEFLYTYTWGEQSYVHEVNEQFGYFTPSGFAEFLHTVLGDEAKLVVLKHYLQDGYSLALSRKITFFDAARHEVPLPDSTCLVVIEKSL